MTGSPTGRQARKDIKFLEAYGCGDIKVGQLTGQYPNASALPIDFGQTELRILANLSFLKDVTS